MNNLLSLSGQGFYIWMAFGITAVVVAAEVIAVRMRRRGAVETARMSMPEPESTATLRPAGRAG